MFFLVVPSPNRNCWPDKCNFQFSDILLYTSRSQATLQFKVHGHMPLRGVLIEEPEGELSNYGLVIYGNGTNPFCFENENPQI